MAAGRACGLSAYCMSVSVVSNEACVYKMVCIESRQQHCCTCIGPWHLQRHRAAHIKYAHCRSLHGRPQQHVHDLHLEGWQHILFGRFAQHQGCRTAPDTASCGCIDVPMAANAVCAILAPTQPSAVRTCDRNLMILERCTAVAEARSKQPPLSIQRRAYGPCTCAPCSLLPRYCISMRPTYKILHNCLIFSERHIALHL